jgi:hypothetical protein
MTIATKEWREVIWDSFLKKVFKFVGYLLMTLGFLLLLVVSLASFLAIFFLLGILWLVSLGHISLVKVWARLCELEMRKFWESDTGKLLRKVYGGILEG